MTALAQFATSSLVFQVPTGNLQTPLGNPATATVPLVVVAYLRAGGHGAQQGIDGQASGQPVSGRMVYPTALPVGVQDGQVAEATFWRITLPSTGWATLAAYQAFINANLESVAAIGEFVLEATPPSGLGVEAVLGDKIRGRFIARSSWTDSI